jgi:hypothetical protein
MFRKTALALVLAGGLCASGCKTSAGARTDAGADARAGAGDAGVKGAPASAAIDGGGSPAITDAGAMDDGAIPAASSDELTLRARHLFDAIVQDNPDLGSDILFPRDAFVLARDATDPGKVWDVKVSGGFRRSVHALHRRIKGADRAQFVSFELGRTITEVTPKHHEWTLPLWHVPHARLTYALDGKTERIDVAELAAWRGAWYVSRLH